MKKVIAVALMTVALTPGLASATEKHGGQEVQVGKFHVELVVQDRDITVHVRDETDKPLDARTIKASANVLAGKDTATVQLVPAGDGLKGQSPFAVVKDAKIVLTFAVGDGKKEQARFSVGAKQDHKGHKH